MALVITIDNAYELKKRFEAANRDYYTLEACDALIEIFEECGENIELDIVAICCDYYENTPADIIDTYDNIDEIAEARDEDGEIDMEKLMDALNYYTYAVELSNGNILYQTF